MSSAATPAGLADRFADFIDALCRLIAADAHRHAVLARLLMILRNHLQQMAERFDALAAAAAAGGTDSLPCSRAPAIATGPCADAAPDPVPRRLGLRLAARAT